MKILDATALIAFLRELDFEDGLRRLSTIHRLVVPTGVASEVKKPPASIRLASLLDEGVLVKRAAPTERVGELRTRFLDIGQGECECVALSETLAAKESLVVVTDDKQVRKRVPGPRYVWTQQLLVYMVKRGLLSLQSGEDLLRKLAASSFYSARPPNR